MAPRIERGGDRRRPHLVRPRPRPCRRRRGGEGDDVCFAATISTTCMVFDAFGASIETASVSGTSAATPAAAAWR